MPVLDRARLPSRRVHFHDTYGQALANVVLSLTPDKLDSLPAGCGCPYAPGAAGNGRRKTSVWLLDGLDEHDGHIEQVASVAARFCSDHHLQYRSRAGEAVLAAAEVEA